MYQVGDLIVYGGTGVCRVMEVGPQTGGRLYYTLEPVYGSCRIFTPVENSKVLMRPIVTRQEAERLIDEIPAIQPEAYYNKVLRELTEHYDTILKTYNCGELLKLTMSIYAKKQEAETQKRRLGAVDCFAPAGSEMRRGSACGALFCARRAQNACFLECCFAPGGRKRRIFRFDEA